MGLNKAKNSRLTKHREVIEMRRAFGLLTTVLSVFVAVILIGCSEALPTEESTMQEVQPREIAFMWEAPMAIVGKKGFSEKGYKGTFDGLDGSVDGLVNGYPSEYVNDKVKIKWNSEWYRGVQGDWMDPNGYPGAKKEEVFDGLFDGGSNTFQHFKYQWYEVGGCGASYFELFTLGAECSQEGTSLLQSIAVVYWEWEFFGERVVQVNVKIKS